MNGNQKVLLDLRDLTTEFVTMEGRGLAVDHVSFHCYSGETLAVVGESGCGKSVTALSVLQLIPSPPGRIVNGSVIFEGKSLLQMSRKEIGRIRGRDIAMIFQEPMTSLNPVFTIGNQIAEAIKTHESVTMRAALTRAENLLNRVGVPDARRILKNYPHHLSGGMRQRVMIAIALACRPKLLIADEPTTALDVTVQAQILKLLSSLQKEMGMGLMLITHDLGVVAQVAQRVVVMYAGRKVEEGLVEEIFREPRHPYTKGLLLSMPQKLDIRDHPSRRLPEIPGMVPSLFNVPSGCSFRNRCSEAIEACAERIPELRYVSPTHAADCIRILQQEDAKNAE